MIKQRTTVKPRTALLTRRALAEVSGGRVTNGTIIVENGIGDPMPFYYLSTIE